MLRVVVKYRVTATATEVLLRLQSLINPESIVVTHIGGTARDHL